MRFHCRHLLRFHCCHSLRFHCCHWSKFLHPSQSSSRSPSRDIWKRSQDYDCYLLSVASKSVHVTKKHVLIGWKEDMFCRVWGGVRRIFTCKVGCSLSTWFVFDQQNIHYKTLRTIYRVVNLQRIVLKSRCAVPEQKILLKLEKKKRWAEHADQKHVNNLTFGETVCFKGCQTSNVWRQNTSCLASD